MKSFSPSEGTGIPGKEHEQRKGSQKEKDKTDDMMAKAEKGAKGQSKKARSGLLFEERGKKKERLTVHYSGFVKAPQRPQRDFHKEGVQRGGACKIGKWEATN